ncbi:MAG TPA: sulfurtransferase complex subunit TusB [Gammaproteobacteria bacterium]|nr:sulfurtransferase complex subunit TusB [Gammaproteobacteria bacterium]
MLHLVNKSPYDAGNLETATAYMQGDDALLLIEDGIYAAIKSGKAAALLSGKNVSVLGADLAARGIGEDKLVEGVTVIDYTGFVDLVEANDKVQSWL